MPPNQEDKNELYLKNSKYNYMVLRGTNRGPQTAVPLSVFISSSQTRGLLRDDDSIALSRLGKNNIAYQFNITKD